MKKKYYTVLFVFFVLLSLFTSICEAATFRNIFELYGVYFESNGMRYKIKETLVFTQFQDIHLIAGFEYNFGYIQSYSLYSIGAAFIIPKYMYIITEAGFGEYFFFNIEYNYETEVTHFFGGIKTLFFEPDTLFLVSFGIKWMFDSGLDLFGRYTVAIEAANKSDTIWMEVTYKIISELQVRIGGTLSNIIFSDILTTQDYSSYHTAFFCIIWHISKEISLKTQIEFLQIKKTLLENGYSATIVLDLKL